MAGKTLIVELLNCDENSMHVAKKIVSKILGIDAISIDKGAKKLTVVCGMADPIRVVDKLRKRCSVKIVSIESTVDEKKKKEGEKKKEDEKKKKEDEKKKKEDEKNKKEASEKELKKPFLNTPQMPEISYPPLRYYSVEDDPNSCAIM